MAEMSIATGHRLVSSANGQGAKMHVVIRP